MTKRDLISTLLIVVGLAPLVLLHLKSVSAQEQYQYWPFVIAAVGFMLWQRREDAFQIPESGRVGNASLVFALLILCAGGFLFAPWLAATSAIIVAGVYMLDRRSKQYITNAFGIWMLLWLVVPLPFGLGNRLVSTLQRQSSLASSLTLDLLGVDHLMQGNTLTVPTKTFFVDEACSGIVSVMSIVASGAIFVVWNNRAAIHSMTLLATGIVWAMLMNIIRIVTIAFAFTRLGIDLSEGSPHTLLGLVLFSCTFMALLSTDQFLAFVFDRIQSRGLDSEPQNALVRTWNRISQFGDPVLAREKEIQSTPTTVSPIGNVTFLRNPIFAATFTLVGLFFGGVLVAGVVRSSDTLQRTSVFSATTLPEELLGMRKVSYERIHREKKKQFGEFSDAYVFETPLSQHVSVSFDYPFPAEKGWKELCDCYRGTGWQIVNREIVPSTSTDDRPWNYVRATLSNSSGQVGYLWFGDFDGTGSPISPPQGGLNYALWARASRLQAYTRSPHLFQTQVWVVAPKELSVKDVANLEETYLKTRELFRTPFVTQ